MKQLFDLSLLDGSYGRDYIQVEDYLVLFKSRSPYIEEYNQDHY
jgi:hypothetical protein